MRKSVFAGAAFFAAGLALFFFAAVFFVGKAHLPALNMQQLQRIRQPIFLLFLIVFLGKLTFYYIF